MPVNNKDADTNSSKSGNKESQVAMGVDTAVGIDQTNIFVFKLDHNEKVLLYRIMYKRNSPSFRDVLADLVKEEAKRMGVENATI